MAILQRICALLLILKISQPGKCSIQAVFHRSKGKYLANHVIATKQAKSESECGIYCIRDGLCLSANYKTSGVGKGRCELNNKIVQETSEADKETNPDFNYLYVIKEADPKSILSKKGTQEKLQASSCKELLDKNRFLSNGVYKLRSNTSLDEYPVYCHMTELVGCGSGGWTLVMKMDGNKAKFNFTSPYWTNKETYAVEDGLKGLTEKQTKLASYWNTPFNKICLGMKAKGETKWRAINYQASSLYNVIADGEFKNTAAGKDLWKSFISGTLWQEHCNKEGFNIESINPIKGYNSYIKVRIGFVSNNQENCESCNGGIGFGTLARGCAGVHWDDGKVRNTTCGYVAVCGHSGNKNTPAFGYILVQ